jgi:hypothetical protein
MSTITLENITATTEPFKLDVGRHIIVVATGNFQGCAVSLEKRAADAHPADGDHLSRPGSGEPIPLWQPVIGPLTKTNEIEFTVAPNAVGDYRIAVYKVGSRVRIVPGSTVPAGASAETTYEALPAGAPAPSINVIIGIPPAGEGA